MRGRSERGSQKQEGGVGLVRDIFLIFPYLSRKRELKRDG